MYTVRSLLHWIVLQQPSHPSVVRLYLSPIVPFGSWAGWLGISQWTNSARYSARLLTPVGQLPRWQTYFHYDRIHWVCMFVCCWFNSINVIVGNAVSSELLMQLFGIERINNEEHASSIFISELENDYSHRVNGVLNELTIQTHTYRVVCLSPPPIELSSPMSSYTTRQQNAPYWSVSLKTVSVICMIIVNLLHFLDRMCSFLCFMFANNERNNSIKFCLVIRSSRRWRRAYTKYFVW